MSTETDIGATAEESVAEGQEPLEDVPQGSVEDEGAAAAMAEGVAPKRLIDERSASVEELAAELAREREASVAADASAAGEAPEEEEAKEAEEPPAAAPILLEEDGETYITLKVDGVETRMKLGEAQAELQRRESGNARLHEAASERMRLQQYEQQIAEREKQLQAKESAPAEPEPPTEDVATIAKGIVSDILNGDEEAAADKLATTLKRSADGAGKATVDTESIAEAAAAQARRDIAEANAFTTFRQEYPDIVDDKEAFSFADMMSDRVLAENPGWTPLQVMREAGERTRKFRGAEGPQAPSSREKAEEAKSRLARVPSSGGGAEVVSIRPPQRKTPEEIVQEMNIQRRGKAAMGLS